MGVSGTQQASKGEEKPRSLWTCDASAAWKSLGVGLSMQYTWRVF